MELQRLHHVMMQVVYVKELDDPTRLDLLEWMYDELKSRVNGSDE